MSYVIKSVLENYQIDLKAITEIKSGHINSTWLVEEIGGKKFILQKINPLFPYEIHKNIEAAIKVLHENEIQAPNIIKNKLGELFTNINKDIWRLQDYIYGEYFEIMPSDDHAYHTSESLAKMQNCWNADKTILSTKTIGHNTKKFIDNLMQTLLEHSEHNHAKDAYNISLDINNIYDSIPKINHDSIQVCHGDPKLTNIIFKPNNSKVESWVDFDTIGLLNPLDELGDAIRSWCNPLSEDNPESYLDKYLLSATLQGYLSSTISSHSILKESIFFHTLKITVELAARFATDILNESYFGWDQKKYERAALHNILRAKAQLEVAKSIQKQKKHFIN